MKTTPRISEILVWFWRFAGNLETSLRPVKLFHVCAAATGNARSPTVDSRVDAEVQRRGRRRPLALSTRNPGDRLKGVARHRPGHQDVFWMAWLATVERRRCTVQHRSYIRLKRFCHLPPTHCPAKANQSVYVSSRTHFTIITLDTSVCYSTACSKGLARNLLFVYIGWQWRHSVCNSYRCHVGGIQRCSSVRVVNLRMLANFCVPMKCTGLRISDVLDFWIFAL